MPFDVLPASLSEDVTGQLCGHYVGRSETKIENIPVSSVWYFFTGTAGRKGLVTIAGFHPTSFHPNREYARTNTGVVLVKNPQVRLDGHQFVQVHQSIVVNLTGWRELDLGGKGFLFNEKGQTREWVPISRRCYRDVRRALGLSPRRESKASDHTRPVLVFA